MKLGKRIGQGYTAEVFEWGSGKIIKVFRPHSAGLMEYEWRISRQVAGLGLPVPAVYGIEKAGGKQGIVYERVAGRLVESITEEERGKLIALVDRKLNGKPKL
ncbi:phosphotransferase [Paenibacillus elgii]